LKDNPPSRAQAIQLMAEFPNLIKRPLLVQGGKILFGFSAAEWAGAL
jgi:arsenate reductase-like glutaredoxin family protein